MTAKNKGTPAQGKTLKFLPLFTLLALGATITVSCAPADLEPIPADASGTDSTSDTGVDTGADGVDSTSGEDVFEPNDEFAEVVSILTAECSDSGCHGQNPNGNFHIEGGMSASPAAVRNALEDVDSVSGGTLIAPGSPDESVIYERITADVGRMPSPPEEPLSSEQITAIETWIENGAEFE
jgi:hypothetical protein